MFTVKLFAGPVYEPVGDRLLITTYPNTTTIVENLSVDDVSHRKRSAEADKATAVLNHEEYLKQYNETIADYDSVIGNLTAALVSITPK